ncbi:MAG: hypothetical protein DHS20C08_17090 [Rhodomicrobium sp.]|nr:MAG: hypothetical protein DHS20C08_17090 [Rhodomicrobium sp.]
MDPKLDRSMQVTPDETDQQNLPGNNERIQSTSEKPQLKALSGHLKDGVANDQKTSTADEGTTRVAAEKQGGVPLRVVFKFLLPIGILIAAVAGYAMLKASKPAPRKPQIVEKVWPVDAVTAKIESVTPTLKLFGKTVSNRSVEMRSLVAGKIIKVSDNLKEGALIRKGEMLVEIDSFDYQGALTEAEANLKEANARKAELEASIELEKRNLKFSEEQLALAERDFKRVENLSKKGTVTKKSADDRKVIVSQREQTVATSTTNIKLQQARLTQQVAVIERLQWKLAQAKRRLEETSLIAPFNAYVNQVNAELGKTVSVNDSIARLIDSNAIDVRFTLSDAQYGRIIAEAKEGRDSLIDREVAVEWKVGETPISYKARITRIGAEISSETGGVEIYARVQNPTEPTPLRTGAFVEVSLDDRSYDNVYKLPQTALYSGDTVYLIENGRLTPVKVKIVNVTGTDMLVDGQITEGATVLKTKLTLAGKGVRVNVRGQNPDDPTAKSTSPERNDKKAQTAKKITPGSDKTAKGL